MKRRMPGLATITPVVLHTLYSGAAPAQETRAFAFTAVVTGVERAAPGAAGVVRLTDTVEVGEALAGWFAFPAAAADLDPRRERGRYETTTAMGAGFRLETDGGAAGLGAADLARATIEIADDGPRGDRFALSFADSWGVIAFAVELSDPSGQALAGDGLPAALDGFGVARLEFGDHDRFAGTRVGFDGRLTSLTAAR